MNNLTFEITFSYTGKYYEELKGMYDEFWKDLTLKDNNKIIQYKGVVKEEPEGCFLIAKLDDKVIGFARFGVWDENWCCAKSGEISDIYVKPEYRNMGYGTLMIKQVEMILLERYECHNLRIAYIEGNCKAGELYKRLGYHTNYTELVKDI